MIDDFKIAIRALLKYKSFTVINILGLTVGKTVFLLILGYVLFERSYDKFHPNHERIYRVRMDEYLEKNLINQYAITFPAVGPALKNEFPEVSDYVRLYTESTYGPVVFNYNSAAGGLNKVMGQKTYYADRNFFTFFNFPLVSGDPETALSEPNLVVLTQQAVARLFKGEDPIGKTILMHDRGGAKTLKITGIAADVPENSHVKFDYIVSYATLGKEEWSNTSWDFNDFTTYVVLKNPVAPQQLDQKLDGLLRRHKTGEEAKHKLTLQPLDDIHLTSDLTQELDINGNADLVNYLFASALLILFISWINYINMSTAASNERAKEVSVRKVLGSSKFNIMRLFLAESLLVNLAGIILSIFLVELASHALSQYLGLTIRSYLFDFTTTNGILYNASIVGLFIAGTFFSGFYPSFLAASFQPIKILRGGNSTTTSTARYRNALVSFQFVITFVLLSFVLAIYGQINFMKKSDLGFDSNNLLVIQAPRVFDSETGYERSIQTFKDELLRQSFVKEVSVSTLVPGIPYNWTADIRRENRVGEAGASVYLLGVDPNFTKMYNIKIVAGKDYATVLNEKNQNGILLNEAAVKMLGFTSAQEAVGKKVFLWENDLREIRGVVRNFNQESLKYQPQPYVLFLFNQNGYFSVKLSSNDFQTGVNRISDVWGRVYPANPINYFVLEDFYNKQYQNDYQFGQMFTASSLFIVIILFIGLSGLLTFFVNRRTKELALRKILGASSFSLWVEVYARFFKLIMIGMLVAAPLSYYLISNWLGRYSTNIGVQVSFFLIPMLFIVLISVLVVAISFSRINSINPAESIRKN